jgi:uncharacterized protein
VLTLAIAIVAGAVIGLSLGALGGGGSILTVPVLVYLLGVQPREATSASLIVVGTASIIAALVHSRAGRVRWRSAIMFGVLGSITAFAGSIANRAVSPQVLLMAFATLMIIAAIAMIRRTRQRSELAPETSSCTKPPATAPSGQSAVLVTTKPSSAATTIKLVASALGVGFLTGFLGVGGGFLIVPALVLALGYSMPIAVGTSLVIISIASAGAFAERLGSSTIPWQIVVPFTVAAIAGSFGGKAISDRVSANTLTRGLAALMIVVAAYMYTRVGLAAVQ